MNVAAIEAVKSTLVIETLLLRLKCGDYLKY